MEPAAPSIEDAIALAALAHRGQRYPSPEAEPYIFHPLRLMLSLSDPLEQMAAILHDSIEDTELQIQDLVTASYPAKVVEAIDCLTRRDGETYDAYIERLATNDVARRVKILDVRENLANNRRHETSTSQWTTPTTRRRSSAISSSSPRRDETAGSPTGRAFHGALIEWLAGAHPSGASPPHEQEPAAQEYLETVQWRGRPVHVPVLELQLFVAERRGLDDRAHLIRSAIAT